MTSEETMNRNKQANELAWLAQGAILRFASGKTDESVTPKLARIAKEALVRLRVLTGGDYRAVIEDLDRLAEQRCPRGTAWAETIDQMEYVLQWTQNAPMVPRVGRTV